MEPHSTQYDAPHLVSTSTAASRVTRSSARLAAAESSSTSSDNTAPLASLARSPVTSTSSRKRKVTTADTPLTDDGPAGRRPKKVKVSEVDNTHNPLRPRSTRQKRSALPSDVLPVAMSDGYEAPGNTRRTSSSRRRQSSPPGTSTESANPALLSTGNSKRKSSRRSGASTSKTGATASSSRRSKRSLQKKELNPTESSGQLSPDDHDSSPHEEDEGKKDGSEGRSDEDDEQHHDDRMDEDDPFASNLLGRMAGNSSITNTLRALGGMMSGMTGRLRGILESLRTKDDPSVQLVALTDLSELLLISNEDNLAGAFSPDQFVKELVVLMQPNDFGEENPEMMLLACRCIANLMEAIPSATASVVYGGAVPILCQKLLEIHYIDLAEQALSTLEKISVEFPSSIVREGGLTACLTYLDFFATSTQRTAVTTAANCCRGIPEESFPVIKDVMPILLNVLSSNDQRVVEQGSLCVCRIIESFRWQDAKLEELVSADLLKAILRLLLPGSTNLIGPSIHTHFLRVLAIAARASPRISVELLRLNVVDTLYQILTGVSPPSGMDDIAFKIDKNVIMQALIRSPKDQIFETLNVICELLPAITEDGLSFVDELKDEGFTGVQPKMADTPSKTSPNEERLQLLADSRDEVRRFAVVLFPTLMHAYTSTVNFNVRQKVLTAHLKMLSNFDTKVIQEALEDLPYASHIASILTQQENPLLVTCALQISEMLINRLGDVYKSSFHREGVIAEITKLSNRPLSSNKASEVAVNSDNAPKGVPRSDGKRRRSSSTRNHELGDDELTSEVDLLEEHFSEEDNIVDQDEHDEHDEHDEDEDEDDSESSSSDSDTRNHQSTPGHDVRDIITLRARKFVQAIAAANTGANAREASETVDRLQALGEKLVHAYEGKDWEAGRRLFIELAQYFSSHGTESITSYEILKSNIVGALLSVLAEQTAPLKTNQAKSAFLFAFRTPSDEKIASGSNEPPTTAFSVLLHKLQDLLSRTEQFEVITVSQNAFDSSKNNATSMLAKQLRLKLSADSESGIPLPFRNIMVSIHAIATFKALDDYLRPRLSLADLPDSKRARRSLLEAAMAKATEASEKSHSDTPASTVGGNKTPSRARHSTSEGTAASAGHQNTASARRSTKSQEVSDEAQVRTPRRETEQGSKDKDSLLECADEKRISDDEASTDLGMHAVVDHLEEEMEEMDGDPSAVNMEVANSGKVTARKDDGTRVATPQQSSQSSTTPEEPFSTPTAPARSKSYASAVQSIPKDWHIEFSIDGQPIPNDTTIYRAVHFNQGQPIESSGRVVWSAIHKISFRRVAGPPPTETKSVAPSSEASQPIGNDLPTSLSRHPDTASILQLMCALHRMNDSLDNLVAEPSNAPQAQEPLTRFINTKLTAKLNRQLEEPLIVASNCLPSWAEDLARLYPFLFPFESRHLFLQSTSFGYSRSMARWQNGQPENESRRHRDERPFLGRTQRQKVRISRNRILESALKVMELYGSSPSILEVEYFEEVGTGLGPTLEFYATISREFCKKKLKLWRENEAEDQIDFAFGKHGLFPAPMSDSQADNDNGKRVLHLFRLLGKFVARSMLDSRIIDIPFNPTFFRICNGADVPSSLGAVALVDQNLAKSLKDLAEVIELKHKIDQNTDLSAEEKTSKRAAIRIRDVAIEDLGLDFTLPGYPSIELEANGANTDVTIDNVERYVERILDMTLGSGVHKQIEAFKTGFSQVFPHTALRAFTPDELVMLFGHAEEDWSLETLMDSIKADHGFNLDSQSVRNLLHTMSDYSPSERRDFLQFVTGSPKLPIGGFKSLTPMFTVVCKPSEPPLTPDDYLPSVMTCVNYLKMPNYTSASALQAKLAIAIKEGQGAFHLS